MGPFSEGPGVAGPALTSKPIEEESEGRRSLLRMLAPVLAVFAVFGALVAALLAFDSSDADEASVASAPAETSVEQPEGAAGGAEGRGQGGGSDDGSQAENGNGGERGGGGERSASVQGGKKQSEPSSNDGQAMRLGFVEVADALRVGLPGDWSQRTVTSDGAVVFAPPEASVTVRAWADSGSGLNRREMASASAELLAARQPNANVGDPEFGGGDVRIRSKYDGGVEVARVFIDDGSRILAVSTVPEGASRVRADEAAAVLASVGAP